VVCELVGTSSSLTGRLRGRRARTRRTIRVKHHPFPFQDLVAALHPGDGGHPVLANPVYRYCRYTCGYTTSLGISFWLVWSGSACGRLGGTPLEAPESGMPSVTCPGLSPWDTVSGRPVKVATQKACWLRSEREATARPSGWISWHRRSQGRVLWTFTDTVPSWSKLQNKLPM